MSNEFLFPSPGSTLRGLLDFKARAGEAFTDDEATADFMLDLDRVKRGTQTRLKPVRYYAARWGWSRSRVAVALSGEADRTRADGSVRKGQPPWIRKRTEVWRSFYTANPADSGGQPADSGGQKPPLNDAKTPGGGQPADSGGQPADSTEQTTDKRERESRVRAREGPDLWEEFWKVYPTKRSKKPAREKWKQKGLHRDAEKASQIIADVVRRTEHDAQWLRGAIPHPSTYLNQERWTDELSENWAGNQAPRGRGGLDASERAHPPSSRAKRDGELNPREYLERSGYNEHEIERMLGGGYAGGDGTGELPASPRRLEG